MVHTFYENRKVYNKNLREYLNSFSGYRKLKVGRIIAWGFVAAPYIFWFVYTYSLIGESDTLGAIIALSVAGGFLACILPFAIVLFLKEKGLRDYGFPYIDRERRIIKIYEDGVEYLFHNKKDKVWEQSVIVYRIPIENIKTVLYDKEIHKFTIVGKGEKIYYDDYSIKRINYGYSYTPFYEDSEYSFLSAFEEEEQIYELLEGLAQIKKEDRIRAEEERKHWKIGADYYRISSKINTSPLRKVPLLKKIVRYKPIYLDIHIGHNNLMFTYHNIKKVGYEGDVIYEVERNNITNLYYEKETDSLLVLGKIICKIGKKETMCKKLMIYFNDNSLPVRNSIINKTGVDVIA